MKNKFTEKDIQITLSAS